MGYLVLNSEIESKMLSLCSAALWDRVLRVYEKDNFILHDDEFVISSPHIYGGSTRSVWQINSFIKNNELCMRDKANVLISYMECGGCVLWSEGIYLSNRFHLFLRRLLRIGFISEEEHDTMMTIWKDYENGKSVPQFELTTSVKNTD